MTVHRQAFCCLLLMTGCSQEIDVDQLSCGSHEGPASVRIEGLCIDSTEVTRSHYQAFLRADPSPNEQLAGCEWNDSFVPNREWPIAPGTENYPVTGVDWCDARAYCAWAGKRLCGRIGGGPVNFMDRARDSHSEWYRACSARGSRAFPYGNTYEPDACNVESGVTRDVASFARCQGGYPGVFDLIGNVWEWTDSCLENEDIDNAVILCDRRGGERNQIDVDIDCSVGELLRRNFTSETIGIRCCAD